MQVNHRKFKNMIFPTQFNFRQQWIRFNLTCCYQKFTHSDVNDVHAALQITFHITFIISKILFIKDLFDYNALQQYKDNL
jgi:hypothetical protein